MEHPGISTENLSYRKYVSVLGTNMALVMLMALVVVGAPWARSSSNYDGIFVGGHAVLHVGRYEQKTANGIGFDMTGIICKAHL